MTGCCYRCRKVRDDVETRYELGAFFLCEPCAQRGRPSGLTGTAPRFRGLERAARVAQILTEDAAAGVRLEQTIRDLRAANKVTFEPPYRAEDLKLLINAKLERMGGGRRG